MTNSIEDRRAFRHHLVASDLRADRSPEAAAHRKTRRLGDAPLPFAFRPIAGIELRIVARHIKTNRHLYKSRKKEFTLFRLDLSPIFFRAAS
jgi:hypothetical protein